jgi:hypothetical protein
MATPSCDGSACRNLAALQVQWDGRGIGGADCARRQGGHEPKIMRIMAMDRHRPFAADPDTAPLPGDAESTAAPG